MNHPYANFPTGSEPEQRFYKPPARFIENLDKWSQPKWHRFDGRIVTKTNPERGNEYCYPATQCGTRVTPKGDFATNKPVIPTSLCKRCFPDQGKTKPMVSSGYRSAEEAEQLRLDAEAKRKSGELPSHHNPSPDMPF